jgi:RNA recognition motif-containing protein
MSLFIGNISKRVTASQF